MPICLRLFWHLERAAASRTFWTAGSSRPISTAMMAITTSSSISVNALLRGWRGLEETFNMDTSPGQGRDRQAGEQHCFRGFGRDRTPAPGPGQYPNTLSRSKKRGDPKAAPLPARIRTGPGSALVLGAARGPDQFRGGRARGVEHDLL